MNILNERTNINEVYDVSRICANHTGILKNKKKK